MKHHEHLKELVQEFKNVSGIIFKYSNYMTHQEMAKFQLWLLKKSEIKFTNVSNRIYE